MPKLVVYDPAWRLYEPLLHALLPPAWLLVCGENDEGWLGRELPDADALLAAALPTALRPAARRLRMLQYPGAGVPPTEPSALPDGCSLVNVYEHETPIAEYVLMTVLMHATQVMQRSAALRAGRWEGSARYGGALHDEVAGQTIGLVGYGHIGQAVAQRAVAFGMRVRAVRQRPEQALPNGAVVPEFLGGPQDVAELFQHSDFVVITCPLAEATRGWIGADELAGLPPHGYLINVARAEIVQEEPLYRALAERRIAGAALDVWYQYPPTGGETGHGSRYPFHELDNVLPTPHSSAWTEPMLERRMRRMVENLERLTQGLPLERVVLVGTWRGEEGDADEQA